MGSHQNATKRSILLGTARLIEKATLKSILPWMLTCAAQTAVAPSTPAFEVVSIKRLPVRPRVPLGLSNNSERMRGVVSPFTLLTGAFGLTSGRVVAPEWTQGEFFEFEALAPSGTPKGVRQRMLQRVLIERFGLKSHFEERPTDIYSLTLEGGGPLKLVQAIGGPPERMTYNPGVFKQPSASMADLAFYLSSQLQREVVDLTGVEGRFVFDLDWKHAYGDPANITPQANGGGVVDPAIVARAVKSIGLKLEPRRMPMRYLVVDSINKEPTPN